MLKEKGQTLAIITLIVLTVLTVAMAIATRTLVGIKETAKQEESIRAHDAAEAGVEEALRRVKSGETPTPGVPIAGNVTLTNQSSSSTYTISTNQGLNGSEYIFRVDKDQAYQVNLEGVAAGTIIEIYWWRSAAENAVDQDPIGDCSTGATGRAAIEFAYLRKDAGGNYSIAAKDVVDGCAASRANNFTAALSGAYQDLTTKNTFIYKIPVTINLQADSVRVLRITPRYNGTWIMVQAHTAAAVPVNLPSQGFIIDSQGLSGDTVRRIRVSRSVATLPAIFDFAIFSGSDQALQK